MNPERWARVEELYHAALELDPTKRDAYLAEACGDDAALRREVVELLFHDSDGDSLFEAPAIHVAARYFLESEDGGSGAGERAGDADTAPARRAPLPIAPGETISHYRVREHLGDGGMGIVYRATDSRLGRDVALKLLPEGFARDSGRMRRFEREARTASALNHPHICTIHDWDEHEGSPFIVMELVDGRTLRDMIDATAPFDTLLRYAADVAKALRAAHDAGIVHRDVKPENIMVRRDGIVKVLDFGLARPVAERSRSSHDDGRSPPLDSRGTAATDAGTILGTVRYMSPEQTRGEPASVASDIFAFGIVLYEMVARVHPFKAETQRSTLDAIRRCSIGPPSQRFPGAPLSLDDLIVSMLAKDPSARPTASEVAEKLDSLAALLPRVREPSAGRAPRRTVGRQTELARLHAAFGSAASGNGEFVAVVGEPGIGKTTLVGEFLRDVGAVSARGRCSERLAGSEAYLPILELLDDLVRSDGHGLVEPALAAAAPSWWAEIAPATDEKSPRAESSASVIAVSQERLKREFVAFLAELLRTHPLVLFIDDLHWSDLSTVDLLSYVGTRLRDLRLLVVVTYRPTEMRVRQHPFLAIQSELQGRGVCHELSLGFLRHEDVRHYLEIEFPDHRVPEELVDIILERTEGNALFMVDLVEHLRERSMLVEEGDAWILDRSRVRLEHELPESTRGMIQRKSEQLGEDERHLLSLASVQGYEFDTAVLARALGSDPAEIEERLAELERVHGFVERESERELPDGTLTVRYRFVHVLYQNLLHSELQPSRRVSWSAAVAEALARFHERQATGVAHELAVLLEAAREFDRAAEQFLLAAKHALDVFAYREASLLAERGLGALGRSAEGGGRESLRLILRLVLSTALTAAKGYAAPDTAASWTTTRRLAEEMGEKRLAYLGTFGLGVGHMVADELGAARRSADRLLEMAAELDDPVLEMGGHSLKGYAVEFMGEFDLARTHLERASALHDPQQHGAYYSFFGYDPGAFAEIERSRVLAALGFLDQAKRRLDEAFAWARAFGHPQTVSNSYHNAVIVHCLRGEHHRVKELAEAGLAYCEEYGIANDRGWLIVTHGAALVALGRAEEGITEMRDAIAALRAMRAEVVFSYYLGLLGDGLFRCGRIREADEVVAEALAIVNERDDHFYEAELLRLRGELLLARSTTNRAAAKEWFGRAMAVAGRQESRLFELRAAVSEARVLCDERDRDGARSVLAPRFKWFTEGFDTADLSAAKGLLDALES